MNAKQTKVLELLMTGCSVKKAAGLVGVSDRQVFRWLKQDVFRLALAELQAGQLTAVSTRLMVLTEKALDTLEDVLRDPGKRGQNVARLAAETILSHSVKWVEVNDVITRIQALEEKVGLT